MKTKTFVLPLVFSLAQILSFAALSAEEPAAQDHSVQGATSREQSAAVRKVLSAAFSRKERSAVIASLADGAAAQKLPADKKAILVALAGYEERFGLMDAASSHYNEAAFADSSLRDDSLLLDAARCSLAANDTVKADGYVRAVIMTCFDEKILVRARVYAAWIQLASGDRAGSLPIVRSYAKNAVFSEYASRLLFTLWWADSDREAKDLLLSAYPKSPEAAIARGEMNLAPVPFWYLMSRNDALVADFSREGSKNLPAAGISPSSVAEKPAPTAAVSPDAHSSTEKPASGDSSVHPVASAAGTASSTVSTATAGTGAAAIAASGRVSGQEWQQVGFFRNREYADELVAKLDKLGFHPVVRTETRPSGNLYYVVLVPEDRSRTAESKLKDAGFESCLVTD